MSLIMKITKVTKAPIGAVTKTYQKIAPASVMIAKRMGPRANIGIKPSKLLSTILAVLFFPFKKKAEM